MKTHVEFRSSAFPAYEGEEAKINPGLWGKRLAEFLQKKLKEEKISTEEIHFEDWGVALPIKNEDFPLWIGCGHDQEYEDGFLCFIEPSKPTIRRWLRKIDTTPKISRIADALDRILRGNPQVRDIRWWSENEATNLGRNV
ncbi:MAG TPA: hypothetical protein VNW30_02125 [Opitutaceae bacterium]|jgi:hypothetical protein|nr:hypothetical protein [Opitutaceae bacterium]